MAVSTTYAPLVFNGNGSTTDFAVTWQFFDDTLVVTAIDAAGVETVKTITTHYTVDGGTDSNGLPATGTVSWVVDDLAGLTAPASGTQVRITRITPKTQASTWGESDNFPQKTIEAALDRETLLVQEMAALDSAGTPLVRHPYIEFAEGSAPGTPSSGYSRLYTKTDGALYHKDDAGTEVSISGQVTGAATSATAASASAAAAANSEAAAAASAVVAGEAAGFKWTYDTSTTMADPGTGDIRFNSATLSSVTAMAIADNSADSGNPDASSFVLSWDDSNNAPHRGTLTIRKASAPQTFAVYSITGSSTDSTGWTQLSVTYVTHSCSFSASDELYVSFTRTGNAGASGDGSGDMLVATYDAANISEQLVGLTATQTLTNKTLTSPTLADATFTSALTLTLADGTPGIVWSGQSIGIQSDGPGDLTFFGATNGYYFADGGLYAPAVSVLDTDESNYLSIVAGSDLTANRTLTLTTGDADRTITINGDITLPAGTAATLAGTETLTNKTLGASTLSGTMSCADNTLSRPKIIDYGITVNAIGATGGGTVDIDLTLGNVVSATVNTSPNTFTFSNPPASGTEGKLTLYLTNGGSQTVNWPASVDWAGGVAPTLTTSGRDVLVFTTIDGGTTWSGFAAGLAMS